MSEKLEELTKEELINIIEENPYKNLSKEELIERIREKEDTCQRLEESSERITNALTIFFVVGFVTAVILIVKGSVGVILG